MATPKVYVICDQNCKFESMTKEQILAAIMQAVNEGTIGDIDAGFITTVKTINGLPLRFFYGEQAAYDELSDDEKDGLFAIITNDTFKQGINEAIEKLQEKHKEQFEGLVSGTFVVKKADEAKAAKTATKLSNNGFEFGRALVAKPTSEKLYQVPQNGASGLYSVYKDLSNKMLIIEVSVYSANIYGNNLICKTRSNPVCMNTYKSQDVTIRGSFQMTLNGATIEFSLSESKTGLSYKFISGSSGGETADLFYITAIYEEI